MRSSSSLRRRVEAIPSHRMSTLCKGVTEASMFNLQPLSETPVTIQLNLNQWIRSDQSGTYHDSVISGEAGADARSGDASVGYLAFAKGSRTRAHQACVRSTARDSAARPPQTSLPLPVFEFANSKYPLESETVSDNRLPPNSH